MVNIKGFFVKSAIALSLFALYGCDSGPDESSYDSARAQQDEDDFVNKTSNSLTREQVNKDCQELVPYLQKMREQDPSIVELYYGVSAADNKTRELHIVRADRDITNVSAVTCDDQGVASVSESGSHSSTPVRMNNGVGTSVHSSGVSPDVHSSAVNSGNAMPQAQAQPTFSDHVFPLVGGVAAGYMLNQFINSGRGNGMNYLTSNYQNTSYQSLDDQDRRKRRGAATSAYINTLSASNTSNLRSGIKSGRVQMPTTSRSYQSKNLSTRQTAVFKSSSSGARSGGYSGGG